MIVGSSGEFLKIVRQHDLDYAHGTSAISHFHQRDDYCASHFNLHAERLPLAKKQFLFFDCETTGLAGGVGTVAFLIGFASFTDDGLETRQYFLTDYGDEEAMLESVLSEFSDTTALVSYNGASFDMPILRNRLIINRVARTAPYQCHLDLLHPVRSLYKRRIQSCSLTSVEENVFGFHREGDIPGYLVPGIYFDWLGSEDTTSLAGVVEHNRLDIVSLALILSRITECHVSGGESLSEAMDVYSFSRMQVARRKITEAANLLRSREPHLEALDSREVDFHRSMTHKRARDSARALPIWERLAKGQRRDKIAQLSRIELAKYFEHKSRKFDRALSYTEEAIRRNAGENMSTKELLHRSRRLCFKIERLKSQ